MATTIPQHFTGIPSLSEAKVAAIDEWYRSALGDEDKASEVETSVFYEGQRMAFESVLCLLYDTTPGDNRDISTVPCIRPNCPICNFQAGLDERKPS